MQFEIVNIENRRGLKMKGVYGRADDGSARSGTTAIYLPGIVLGSTAVHRLAFELAEQLARQGVATLICDHSRVGESEGEFPPQSHNDLANEVRAGAFVDDTMDMIDWLATNHASKDVVLVGHCGGSLTALYTALKHDSVRGLYLISPPLTPASEAAASMSSQSADEYYALYKRKFFSANAWKKLLTGKSNYRTILQTVMRKLRGLPPKHRSRVRLEDVVEERLLEAFREIRGTVPITMVIGDKDPDIESFRAFSNLTPAHPNLETEVFEQTSHGFVTEESLDKLKSSIRSFPARLAQCQLVGS